LHLIFSVTHLEISCILKFKNKNENSKYPKVITAGSQPFIILGASITQPIET